MPRTKADLANCYGNFCALTPGMYFTLKTSLTTTTPLNHQKFILFTSQFTPYALLHFPLPSSYSFFTLPTFTPHHTLIFSFHQLQHTIPHHKSHCFSTHRSPPFGYPHLTNISNVTKMLKNKKTFPNLLVDIRGGAASFWSYLCCSEGS